MTKGQEIQKKNEGDQRMSDIKRDGDVILLLTAGYWAKAETIEEARSNLIKWGAWRMLRKAGYIAYSIHPDTQCDEDWHLMDYPENHKPIEIANKLTKRFRLCVPGAEKRDTRI